VREDKGKLSLTIESKISSNTADDSSDLNIEKSETLSDGAKEYFEYEIEAGEI